MGKDEARLRAMAEPNGIWYLSDEDRAAIRWAFARIETLEGDKNYLHDDRAAQWHNQRIFEQEVRKAAEIINRVIGL